MYQRMTVRNFPTICFVFAALFAAVLNSSAQNRQIEETPLLPRDGRQQDEPPQGVRDMLIRMQIEKTKKDFEERLDRADRASKLSRQIESAIEKTSSLSSETRQRIEDLEKLTKDVLNDLGGDAGDLAKEVSEKDQGKTPVSTAKELDDAVLIMAAELKKTTRFTISAAAIESGGAVLRIVRVLKAYR